MQPLNQRSEMGSKNQSTLSGVDTGVSPNGKGGIPAVQQQQPADEPRRVSLAELFSEDDEESSNSNSVADDDPSKPPETMEQLTRRLGLKPEQVYGVKIPLADGAEALTIGQLKDRVSELVDFETRETQFEQRRIKAEGELLRSQSEIRELLAMVPKEHISPEIVNKIRKRHDDNMKRERQLTLEHIPEWHDEKKHAEDLQGIIEFMGDYGFDDGFISTVTDHRALKFIRDMYLRDRRIKAALAKVTDHTKNGQRPSAKTKRAAARPTQQPNKRAVTPDNRSRIASLFSQSE